MELLFHLDFFLTLTCQGSDNKSLEIQLQAKLPNRPVFANSKGCFEKPTWTAAFLVFSKLKHLAQTRAGRCSSWPTKPSIKGNLPWQIIPLSQTHSGNLRDHFHNFLSRFRDVAFVVTKGLLLL